jgi:predicted negative regulator of RcsB-dependent stress response
VRSSRSLSVGIVLVGALLLVGCKSKAASSEQTNDPAAERGGDPAAAAAATPAPPPGLSAEAFQAYEAAKQSVEANDLATARGHFQDAVAAQPDFTEGWYNLGATTTRLAAVAALAGQDPEAIALFREGVNQKRRAESLIGQGKWYIYTPQQQEQVISDLQHALEDVDAVLADEPSLLAAMRMWAEHPDRR